jgi:ribosomal protein S18 acetylase RimI-like enzyme
MKKQNLNLLANTIYLNFIHLERFPNLKHSKNEILSTLLDKNVIFIVSYNPNSKKIIGYILGYTIKLKDNRKVLYISYLFVAPSHRKNGIGSELLQIAEIIASKRNCGGMMLTCDTENRVIYDFYLMKQYMPDAHLRKYDRYDILYKKL